MKPFFFNALFLFGSVALFAQSNQFVYDSLTHTEKYLDVNGRVQYEIIQLDKVPDKHRHIIYYGISGQKTLEFYDKDRKVYDTLRKWTDEGKLYHQEIYNSKGYTTVDYWGTGKISEIGKLEISKEQPKDFVVYDSASLQKYTIARCELNETCYIRVGIWKAYHKNGILAAEGKYLPWRFRSAVPMKDTGGAMVAMDNTSFNISPNVSYGIGEGYLKDGKWKYYDDAGKLIREEFYKNGVLVKN
ncbi:MAG TPA: hypothetical protein VFF27_18370 [Bacteroidia bacterium]|jgi:antitoxin component YwqK of YwqJK toxin-antitoxin module|nr:hypothetical protein [Bacteroidia bacterium]